jgi:SusD family
LRYADVLLLKAEALNESGGSTTEAIGQINMVRARARGNGTVPANRSTTVTGRAFDGISRRGQRWFDLRRWTMSGKIALDDDFLVRISLGLWALKKRISTSPFPTLRPTPIQILRRTQDIKSFRVSCFWFLFGATFNVRAWNARN